MKIALVCSHGGHLTETLQLLPAFEGQAFFFATYHSSRDEDLLELAPAYFTENIGASPVRLALATWWALRILLVEKPDVVLSLGSEIALPFFYLSKLLRIKSIFIESWCRVEGLSKTGKLVYPVADVFLVQWPQMLAVCGPKARYAGAVI